MDLPLLAHAGHWALWVVYLSPVLIVLAAAFQSLRLQRREERDDSERADGIERARRELTRNDA